MQGVDNNNNNNNNNNIIIMKVNKAVTVSGTDDAMMQMYSSDPKVNMWKNMKRDQSGKRNADEIELEFWPGFSTKIIVFHLDKIHKVFLSQAMQKFSLLNVKPYYSVEEIRFWSVCLWMLS